MHCGHPSEARFLLNLASTPNAIATDAHILDEPGAARSTRFGLLIAGVIYEG
jgi:hypothetical protein